MLHCSLGQSEPTCTCWIVVSPHDSVSQDTSETYSDSTTHLWCRHLPSLPSSLPSSSSAHLCGLVDALLEAPTLLATVPCQDWAALAGCNRRLHSVIHSAVQAITVNHASEVSHCVKGTWQQLALIKAKPSAGPDSNCYHRPLPDNTNFQLIASLSSSGDTEAIAKDVWSHVVTELSQGSHIAVALSHLSGLGWQHVEYHTVKLYLPSVDVIAQLVQLDLQYLRSLTISDNMGLAAIQRLAQGAWPQLDTLDLSENLIDKLGMSALTLGKWPLLRRLILDDNCQLTPAAITRISEASNWVLLSDLSLQGAELGTAGACATAGSLLGLKCKRCEDSRHTTACVGALATPDSLDVVIQPTGS